MKILPLLAAGLLVSTSGCQTAPRDPVEAGAPQAPARHLARAPAEVYRAHPGTPITPGAIVVAPADLARGSDPDTAAFVASVEQELGRLGFSAVRDPAGARYLASVRIETGTGAELDQRYPTELRGQAAGSWTAARATALVVRIHDAQGNALAWQGRSSTYLPPRGPLSSLAPLLARALFEGFPGQSGRSIRR